MSKQESQVCPVCKGQKELRGWLRDAVLNHATIRCDECRGTGAVPAGDLAQWRGRMEELIEAMRVHLDGCPQAPQPDADALLHEFEEIVHGQGRMCDEMTCPHTDCLAARLRDYLVELPQPNAELLEHLKKIVARADGKDTRVFADLRKRTAQELSDSLGDTWLCQLRHLIAQAEQGAAG